MSWMGKLPNRKMSRWWMPLRKCSYLMSWTPCHQARAPNSTGRKARKFPTEYFGFQQVVAVGKGLFPKINGELKDFLWKNLDLFAWRHEDMVGIDPRISCYHLNIDHVVDLHS